MATSSSSVGVNPPSSLASSLAPSLAPKTDQELEVIARKVLVEIQREIQCSHDIVSRFELVYLQPTNPITNNLDYYYRKFGESFLKFLQFSMKLQEIREVAQLALQECDNLKYPSTATMLAISKFGVGECHEMTQSAVVKCSLLGLKTLLISLTDTPIITSESHSHCFVLLDIGDSEFTTLINKHEGRFIEILSHLEHGVLLDPFLGLVCQLKEFKNKGKGLMQQYAHAYNVHLMSEMVTTQIEDLSQSRRVQEEALRIYEKTQQFLNTPEVKQRLKQKLERDPITFKGMELEVLRFICTDIITELQRVCPKSNITWKRNVEQRINIWTEGSSAQMEGLHDHLQGLGITLNVKKTQIKNGVENVYAGFLDNPNLNQLRAIPSPYAKPPAPSAQ